MHKFIFAFLACLAISVQAAPGEKCGIARKTCVAANETRLIDGMSVYRDCWEWAIEYACIQPAVTTTCDDPVARGGVLSSTSCVQGVTIDGAFECINENREYAFTKKPAGTTSELDCSGRQYCIDGNCFDVGSAPDPDFKNAVVGMEAMRQAGGYLDDNTFEVFKGQDKRCSKNVAQNCCKGTGSSLSGLTNLAIMGGSAYAFDVLGVATGRSAVFGLGFEPTTFALSIAVAVVTEMLKCDKEETLLAVKREKRLCHYVGEYCSRKLNLGFTKICISHKETYCCFNSKISRIINEAARKMLPGLGWGSAESPSCNGLTIAQFQSLDLSSIDFSEMYDDIVPKMPNPATVTATIESKTKCYFSEACDPPGPGPSCTTPWGDRLSEGGSVTAYQAASVSYPGSCKSESRVCSGGALTGSFTHKACTESCGTWERRIDSTLYSCTQCPGDQLPSCEPIGVCDKFGRCTYY